MGDDDEEFPLFEFDSRGEAHKKGNENPLLADQTANVNPLMEDNIDDESHHIVTANPLTEDKTTDDAHQDESVEPLVKDEAAGEGHQADDLKEDVVNKKAVDADCSSPPPVEATTMKTLESLPNVVDALRPTSLYSMYRYHSDRSFGLSVKDGNSILQPITNPAPALSPSGIVLMFGEVSTRAVHRYRHTLVEDHCPHCARETEGAKRETECEEDSSEEGEDILRKVKIQLLRRVTQLFSLTIPREIEKQRISPAQKQWRCEKKKKKKKKKVLCVD
eukprot:Selendium_serpulae@DN1160_c0_g1_i8.p1